MKTISIDPTINNLSRLAATYQRAKFPLNAICLGILLSPTSDLVQAEYSFGELEEITVTARKREESIQDTPISITAFSSAELEARQVTGLHQVSESTPNLVFDPVGVVIKESFLSASSILVKAYG